MKIKAFVLILLLAVSCMAGATFRPVMASKVRRQVSQTINFANLYFIGVSGAVTVSGYYVDGDGNEIGNSFTGSASATTPTALSSIATVPGNALGVYLLFSGNTYFAVTASTTDFAANKGNYPIIVTTTQYVAFGRAASPATIASGGSGGGGGGGAVTVADGADVTLGAKADAAVGDATGTLNAHARQIAKSLAGTITIAGTITANLGTLNGAATAALQTSLNTLIGGGLPASLSAEGRLKTEPPSSQVFFEDWSGYLNGSTSTLNAKQWNTATVASGATVTPSAGNLALVSGTTASSYGYTTSKPNLQPTSPGFIVCDHQLQLPATVPTHAYAAWGMGNPAATPTSTAYSTDGFEFEEVGPVLSAVTWTSGTRNLIATLTTPVDGLTHKYEIVYKGDLAYWRIDGATVATMLTGASGPNINTLPAMLLAGNDSTGGTSLTVNSAAVYIGDTGKNSSVLADGTYPWQKAGVNAQNGLQTSPTAASSGGATTWNNSAASITTAVTVDSSPGSLFTADPVNTSTTTSYYLAFFNAASGSVTIGSTVPIYVLTVPPGTGTGISGGYSKTWSVPLSFTTALSCAFVTTPFVSTMAVAPANTCGVSLTYK